MDDDLSEYLTSELGFVAHNSHPGLDMAMNAFLGEHLLQKKPIQEQAINIIYEGKDALLISATASGKTEAAMIPLSALLLINPEHVVLYVAPTRALLNDLFKRLEAPLHQLGLDLRVRHGDVPLPKNATSIRVLLTTPESLDVLLSKNIPLLNQVNHLILDEIHQLYGNPRGDQLLFLAQRLEAKVGRRIQRIALSATVGNPEEISQWFCPQRDPARIITTSEKREILGQCRWMSTPSQLHEFVTEGSNHKVLCFVNSRKSCDDTYLNLKDIEPYQSFIHYSTLSKEQRNYVEHGFKDAEMAICVATSTLELGIDIGSIEKVVLVEPSLSVISFLQRIGRGGRRGPYTTATLISKTSLDLLKNLAILALAEKGQIESEIAGDPYSVLVQQIFTILVGKRRLVLHPDELAELFGVFSWYDHNKTHLILDNLVEAKLLHREPNSQIYGVGSNLENLIEKNEIFTNIIGSEAGMPVYNEGRFLANLPLNPRKISRGNVLLYAGRYWRIDSVNDNGISVSGHGPVTDPIRPIWSSRGIFNMSLLLAQGIRNLLLNRPAFINHNLDARSRNQLDDLYRKSSQIPKSTDAIWLEHAKGKYIYYTFAGALGNKILCLIFEQYGFLCTPVKSAEGIALESDGLVDFEVIPNNSEAINTFLNANWHRVSTFATTGPFFVYLPTSLKREEVLSRINNGPLVKTIADFHKTSIIPVDLELVN